MSIDIESSWKICLADEFLKPYFKKLTDFVRSEKELEKSSEVRIFPPNRDIFSAFNNCQFQDVKVVIIGQDPYHGIYQANGLSFSVRDGIPFPPSLQNIFRELKEDIGIPIPQSGNLERWAKQGVLLLNATLTVRKGEAGSHQGKGWEQFTDAVIQQISDKNQNVVFLLWGGFAKKKGKIIDGSKHHILESGHPSPLSANKGHWFGNKHFSKTNSYLKSIGKNEIIW